jgi:hypothetical protein
MSSNSSSSNIFAKSVLGCGSQKEGKGKRDAWDDRGRFLVVFVGFVCVRVETLVKEEVVPQ